MTHLVVDDRKFQGRLVPLSLVDVDATQAGSGSAAPSRSSASSILASHTVGLYGDDADLEHSDDLVLLRSVAGAFLADSLSVTCDILTSGEVAVRRGDHVHATEGSIGQL